MCQAIPEREIFIKCRCTDGGPAEGPPQPGARTGQALGRGGARSTLLVRRVGGPHSETAFEPREARRQRIGRARISSGILPRGCSASDRAFLPRGDAAEGCTVCNVCAACWESWVLRGSRAVLLRSGVRSAVGGPGMPTAGAAALSRSGGRAIRCLPPFPPRFSLRVVGSEGDGLHSARCSHRSLGSLSACRSEPRARGRLGVGCLLSGGVGDTAVVLSSLGGRGAAVCCPGLSVLSAGA